MNLHVRPRVKLRKFKDRFHYRFYFFSSWQAEVLSWGSTFLSVRLGARNIRSIPFSRKIRKLNLLLLSLSLSSL